MSGQLATAITRTSTGQFLSDPAEVTAVGLKAGSDAATAYFYDGTDATGPLRWVLSASATNTTDRQSFDPDLRFENGVFVGVTGTSPVVMMAVRRPKAA